MRDFFINALEKLIGLIIILMGIGTIIGAVAILFSGQDGAAFMAPLILIGGALYMILFGGMMYLFFGIYQNTKRTAELLDRSGG